MEPCYFPGQRTPGHLDLPILQKLPSCPDSGKFSPAQRSWEMRSLVQMSSHLQYSIIDWPMELIFSQVPIKKLYYVTRLWWAQRHLRVWLCLRVTCFHWTKDEEIWKVCRVCLRPGNPVWKEFHFSKAGTPSSLHHSVGSNEGRELYVAQPKFLTFGREKMYITRVKKVKQYEQEIKVKCRVFGS